MRIWIFCTNCERAFHISLDGLIINLNTFQRVSDLVLELESQLGITEYDNSFYKCCYYEDCDSRPDSWVFWEDYRSNAGEGLNWPSTPELNIFYQS